MKTSAINIRQANKIQEHEAAAAFNKQSAIFDEIYSPNIIIQYKRKRVREHVEKFLSPNSSILELNAGTGEDAIYFAKKDHRVHATDIAEGMQKILVEKGKSAGLADNITTELCSFTLLETLANKGPYDYIFSNFAGLNCTCELDKVLKSFSRLLKTGGVLTMVIMPPFCLWETMLALKGNFKTAFRRFNSKNGVAARIEGLNFSCWYYKPSFIIDCLKNDFELLGVEGLCGIVPPSYFENFPKKFPHFYRFLERKENSLNSKWPWKNSGDYYIISLKKIK